MAVPKFTPVNMPAEVIVAIVLGLTAHAPPEVALDSEVVRPTQALVAPMMAEGSGLTVTLAVRAQPAPEE
jgi:hypothetical protein